MKHIGKIILIITVFLVLIALVFPFLVKNPYYSEEYNNAYDNPLGLKLEQIAQLSREYNYQNITIPQNILFSVAGSLVLSAFMLSAYRSRKTLKTLFLEPPTETTKGFPLELRKTFNSTINFVKTHPYRLGIPLILLGATLWIAFPIYIQRIATPMLWGTQMFQLLLYTAPTLSIIITIAGALTIVLSRLTKKQR